MLEFEPYTDIQQLPNHRLLDKDIDAKALFTVLASPLVEKRLLGPHNIRLLQMYCVTQATLNKALDFASSQPRTLKNMCHVVAFNEELLELKRLGHEAGFGPEQ